jgi:hypothetical protein
MRAGREVEEHKSDNEVEAESRGRKSGAFGKEKRQIGS